METARRAFVVTALVVLRGFAVTERVAVPVCVAPELVKRAAAVATVEVVKSAVTECAEPETAVAIATVRPVSSVAV